MQTIEMAYAYLMPVNRPMGRHVDNFMSAFSGELLTFHHKITYLSSQFCSLLRAHLPMMPEFPLKPLKP